MKDLIHRAFAGTLATTRDVSLKVIDVAGDFLRAVVITSVLLSPVTYVEFYNHFKAGDELRPWLITDDTLVRLRALELKAQALEQEIAMGQELDEKMARIDKAQEANGSLPKAKRKG